MDTRTPHFVGRFAPSPTGPLHFGSLTLALASYLNVKSQGGQWLVRMEDLDPPREQPGARQLILEQLSAHGLKSDLPVTYQSERIANYHSALDVRYAISDEMVMAAYIHPLDPLVEAQVESAVRQVASAVQSFGGAYSSGELLFGPGRNTGGGGPAN